MKPAPTGWFPQKDPPLLVHPGDRGIYRPVDREESERIQKRAEKGIFTAEVTP